MEKVKAEEFLQPKAMLTPGIAGGVTMLIANALWVAFSLPPRWTSLALSFLLGLLVFVATTRVPVWQRAVYYLLNSLIISICLTPSSFSPSASARITSGWA